MFLDCGLFSWDIEDARLLKGSFCFEDLVENQLIKKLNLLSVHGSCFGLKNSRSCLGSFLQLDRVS